LRGVGLVVLLVLGAAVWPAVGNAAAPGQLYAFGDNFDGELGNSINNLSSEANPTPALVTLPGETGPVAAAAGGTGFSLVATSTGQLYTFGENYYGQLGKPSKRELLEEMYPTPAPVTLPDETGPVIQVAGGSDHSLVLTSSGQLYAFGYNWSGQLGNTTNSLTSKANPTPTIVTLPGASGPVTQVAAGAFFSLAVTSAGQLYAFGDDARGELGVAPDGSIANPTPTLVTLPGESGPVVRVAAGSYFSLVVTATGQLYAFGENDYGQLGDAKNKKPLEPHPTPTLVTLPGESGPVVQVAAGSDHSLALTATGQLYAFGENDYGQLGNATNNGTEIANPTPTLVRLPGASGRIVRIAAGKEYSLALTSTGQLYAFGADYYGELGIPPGTGEERGEPHPTPTQVPLPGANIETMGTGNWSDQTLMVLADLSVTRTPLPAGEMGVAYIGQAQGAGGVAPYAWSATGLPPGLSIDPESGAISGTPAVSGRYTATITVTDADDIEASAREAMTVDGPDGSPPPSEPPPPSGETPPPREAPPLAGSQEQSPPSGEPPPPSASRQTQLPLAPAPTSPPPSVRDARESGKRWREDSAPTHGSVERSGMGTGFFFSLNEQATVTFSFTQLRAAHQDHRGCLARVRKRSLSTSCPSTVTRGTLSVSGHSGVNSVPFGGWISRAAELRPGRYELVITATSSTGQSSAPVTLSFTITS
jgi:alpha-tubulin suppressor-like RCC1 family protein